MDIRKASKMLFILSAASLVLPWFTNNADIMGYCFGSQFYVFFIMPMLMVWCMLFGNGPAWIGIVGALTDIAVMIYALGGWMNLHNISTAFMLKEGIHTTVCGFWISCILFIALLAAIITDVLKKSQTRGMENMVCC